MSDEVVRISTPTVETVKVAEFIAGVEALFVSRRLDIVVVPGPVGPVYPTDGDGAFGSSDPFVDGFLKDSQNCHIDAILCTFNSSGGGLVLYDAFGNQLGDEYFFTTPMPQPYFFPIDLPIRTAGGFQVKATGYADTEVEPPVVGNGVGFEILFHDTSE